MRYLYGVLAACAVLLFSGGAHAACTSPAGNEGQVVYNTAYHVPQYCNGMRWTAFSNLDPAGGGGNCTGPTAPEGRILYNNDFHVLQYCDGTNWVQVGSSSTLPPPPGYLVQSTTKWNGNLGGLAGADAKCLTELQTTYDWNGKSNAGTLTAARVHALLCDGTSCNNLKANSTYVLAKAGSLTACGFALITDSSGQGPNMQNYWDENCYNSASDEWTNRGTVSASTWSNTPQGANHCTNWTSASSGVTGQSGNAGNLDASRWNNGVQNCNVASFLMCAVDP